MNSLEKVLLLTRAANFAEIEVFSKDRNRIVARFLGSGVDTQQQNAIHFEDQPLGELRGRGEQECFEELAKNIAPLLHAVNSEVQLERNLNILAWLDEVRQLAPDICDWVGIYWKESFLKNSESEFLLLGPYIGESTEHLRIAMNSGFCGLALSEERVVNVADVRADSRHIACSLKTRSEIVIPLANKESEWIAELDIDSNRLAAFTSSLENRLRQMADGFKYLI